MKKTYILAQSALFAAISILAVILIRIPLIPAAPFLVYDMADIPVFLAAMLFGPWVGLAVLFVVCFVQAFLLGGDGWVGFLMHFVASGLMTFLISFFYRRRAGWKTLLWSMTLAVVIATALMIPMNLIFTVHFLGSPRQVVIDMILPAIVPFNLLKGVLNCLLTAVVFRILKPVFAKTTG